MISYFPITHKIFRRIGKQCKCFRQERTRRPRPSGHSVRKEFLMNLLGRKVFQNPAVKVSVSENLACLPTGHQSVHKSVSATWADSTTNSKSLACQLQGRLKFMTPLTSRWMFSEACS